MSDDRKMELLPWQRADLQTAFAVFDEEGFVSDEDLLSTLQLLDPAVTEEDMRRLLGLREGPEARLAFHQWLAAITAKMNEPPSHWVAQQAFRQISADGTVITRDDLQASANALEQNITTAELTAMIQAANGEAITLQEFIKLVASE